MLAIVAAVSLNGVIGQHGKIPWYLPSDLKHFRNLTVGPKHTVIMGRKTYESLPDSYRPLPDRSNVVLSRSLDWQPKGVTVCHSWPEARELTKENDKTFIIGGQEIFKLALPEAQTMFLTIVEARYLGDTLFPSFSLTNWELTEESPWSRDKKDEYPFRFQTWQRRT